jgi:hypothetical protein
MTDCLTIADPKALPQGTRSLAGTQSNAIARQREHSLHRLLDNVHQRLQGFKPLALKRSRRSQKLVDG